MLARHSLNSVTAQITGSILFIETFRMLDIAFGCALSDCVTFLRFLKQYRACNSHNNLY